jgi:hypothetical protein
MEWNKEYRQSSHIYGQLIFYKASKSFNGGKDSLFNKWCWENWLSTCKRIKFNLFLIPIQNYLKMGKDLNLRAKTIKFLEENKT